MSWLLQRPFLGLLFALAMFLMVCPMLRDVLGARVLFDIVLTVVFLTAFLIVFRQGSLRLLALVLGIPTVVGAWTGYVLPGLPRLPLIVGFHFVAALFFTFTTATILKVVHQEKILSADSIYGAFCGYLLVGMTFGHLYCLLEALAPGSFRVSETFSVLFQDEDRRHVLLTYFSIVTLTTVGYGDITPVSESAGGLAVVESVVGQFYIAVLVAELIGKRVSQAIAGQRSDPNG